MGRMQASGVQYGMADVSQFMVGRGPSSRVQNIFQVSSPSSDLQQQYSSQTQQHQQYQQQHHVSKNHQPQPPQLMLRQQEHLKDQMVAAAEKVGEGSAYNSPCKHLETSPTSVHQAVEAGNLSTDKASSSGVAAGGDDDVFGVGEDCERLAGGGGGSAGNRWPREETLALLKIRSEMDANFRDASLKGPLWEHVSRKLEEQGYHRDPKKCKEKFENIHKYYKRSKEGRVGRQDGKNYRFFSQLEALYSNKPPHISNKAVNDASTIPNGGDRVQAHADPTSTRQEEDHNNLGGNFMVGTTSAGNTDLNSSEGISFSSDSSEDYDQPRDSNNKKRKRSGTKKLMAFFETLMKQMMEKQEKMQQKFLEALEKREEDRMMREEAWKRQEMARLNKDQELRSQERSMAAARDLALVSFLQKFTGQTLQLDTQLMDSSQIHSQGDQEQEQEQDLHDEQYKDLHCTDPNSKRWPKPEVLALIKVRSGMGSRFQETGPKGPLWEDISAQMSALGYKRSSKRCKEKWENINKYYKKTKESNKKRPENSKTCPYFYQLDALYRRGMLSNHNKMNQMHEEDLRPDDEDNQDELLEQVSGSNIRDDSGQGQGADGDGEILPVRPPPLPFPRPQSDSIAPPQTPTSNAPVTLFSTPENRNADNGSLPKDSLKREEGLLMKEILGHMQTTPTRTPQHDPPSALETGSSGHNNIKKKVGLVHSVVNNLQEQGKKKQADLHYSASTRDANSFMEMVQKLTAADPLDFNLSAPSQ